MAISDIEARIREIVEAELGNGRPLLLSSLGQKLGSDLRTLKALTGSGLAEFIIERMGQEYSVVLSGEFRNVQSLVRSGSASETLSEQVPIVADSAPHYHRSFWSAFSLPLPPNSKRLLDPVTLRFADVPEGETRPNWLEIPADLVVGEQVAERDKSIAENISVWFDRTGQLQAPYLKATRRRPAPARDFQHMTVLDLMIASLDNKQLSSVSLPLDVVSALLKRRV